MGSLDSYTRLEFFFFLFILAHLWQMSKSVMTNVSCVGLGLILSAAHYAWALRQFGGRRRHCHVGHMLSTAPICQTVKTWQGCTFLHQQRSGTQHYRRASLPYTPCKRDLGKGEQAYWALCLEPEGEPFKRHSTRPTAPPSLQLHCHSRKCDTGFFRSKCFNKLTK